ncbi:MAG: ABC transporter ATP-binding protein [Marmoricola sp.]
MTLRVDDLRVSYGDRTVAHLPHLCLEPGQVIGIAGESGSGKSQTALALMGLTHYAGGKVTGSASLAGIDLTSISQREWRQVRGRRIAMIMQSPRSALNPTLRLGTLFSRTLKLHGVARSQHQGLMEKALDEVLLEPQILNRYPHQVSGGQAQRFAIALVAALQVEVLIADEPTSALDVTVQAEVIEVLQGLRRRHNTSLLFISHDLALISELADEAIVMRDGTVVEQGKVGQILADPASDYTRALIDAVPRIGAGNRE